MDKISSVCERFYTMMSVPIALVQADGNYIQSWPAAISGMVLPEFSSYVLNTFKEKQGDTAHPLIQYLSDGYFVGVIQLDADRFLIIGFVSFFQHTQKELVNFAGPAILPNQLQNFIAMVMAAPIMNLNQLKSYMSLLTQALTHSTVVNEDILFNDDSANAPYISESLSDARFRQREAADLHAATNYESGVCDAISMGRSDLLAQRLIASPGGSIGMMSPNPLRQQQYAFISFATLISRAAIRGGLPEETAFLLSDLYCQRLDSLSSIAAIEKLTVGMAMDFCEQVAKNRLPRNVSPLIQKALSYITVHLHDSFGMEDLSEYCHLCRRSLTIRFQEEMGMTVGEYVQREKTQEAKFLLHHTTLTISEIAAYLNYSSQSYFTQQFKRYAEETPERYRIRKAKKT